MHEYLWNNDDTNRHDNMGRENIRRPQPSTKNYQQLRNAESGKNSLPQGRTQQLVIQYQMVNPENVYMPVTI